MSKISEVVKSLIVIRRKKELKSDNSVL